jgi:putative ABC transport system ATP-binding protein
MNSAMTLVAEGLAKMYRDGLNETIVLREASLNVQAREIVTLEGPSGSGKSTLLAILGCVLTPTAGQMWIGEEAVDFRNEEQLQVLRKTRIGFIFQHFNLFPALTALDNVALALRIRGVPRLIARARASQALGLVDMEHRQHFRPQNLSGGQKQRVAIARAIIGEPALLLADEPTAYLDPATGREMLNLFAMLAKERGIAALIVTHDAKVREIADRVLTIQGGEICHETTMAGR